MVCNVREYHFIISHQIPDKLTGKPTKRENLWAFVWLLFSLWSVCPLTIDVRQKRQIKIQATNYGGKVAWASPEQKEWFVRNKNRPGSACRVRLVWALWVELDSAVWSSPPPPTPPPPPLPSYMLCPKDTYNLVCLALFYRSLFLERKNIC